MSWHKEIWTYLIVTLVAVLIWAWAASETRERKTIPTAEVQFVAAQGVGEYLFSPADVKPSLNVEGTKLSVQMLSDALRKPVRIVVPVNAPSVTIDLAEQLRMDEDIAATGATIVSTDPERVLLTLDKIEQRRARVKATLPGVTPEGEIVVQPREVSVSLPESVKRVLPANFEVEAVVERSQLDALPPGEQHTIEAPLRLPSSVAGAAGVRIIPAKVRISFTIRSRIRETMVESARVQIAIPPEDHDPYDVEVDPKSLQNFIVLANAEVSRQIESGEYRVIAVVHLSSREKELLIDRKQVSMYVALLPTADGGTRYEQLDIKDDAVMPEIKLKITRREVQREP